MPHHLLPALTLALTTAAASGAPFPTDHPADRSRDIPAYTVYAPADADTAKTYPVILHLPPGTQTADIARSIGDSFRSEVTKRGWVMIVPRPTLSPGTTNPLLFERANTELAGLVRHLDTWLRPEGGKFYIIGASNGGVSAVRFGLDMPDRTAALLAFPGAMPPALPKTDTAKLKGFPIRLFVGENDSAQWRDAARFLDEAAKIGDLDLTATTVPAEGHVIRSLSPTRIMDDLAAIRSKNTGTSPAPAPATAPAGAPARPQPAVAATQAVFARLDELHAAASSAFKVGPAAFDRYFACFTPNAVFIGTDASERWTIDQFKAYTKPLFDQKKGWTYTPRPDARHVDLAPDGQTAWFDELLDHAKYGTTRGTGVLIRSNDTWLIAQYHLTIPIPNEQADRITKMIKAAEKK